MSVRVADPRVLRWFHFLPLVLGAVAFLWLIWAALFGQDLGLIAAAWKALWIGALTVGLSFLASYVCHHRTGLGAPVALWLCLIWAKDKTIGQADDESDAQSDDSPETANRKKAGATGLGALDTLVVAFIVLFVCWWVWRSGLDVAASYLPAVGLVGIALLAFAWAPGVPSASLSRWGLRPVQPDENRTARLVDSLKHRLLSHDEVLSKLHVASLRGRAKEEDTGPDVADAQGADVADEQLAAKEMHEYSLSIVRTPVAIDAQTFSAEPETIGVETIRLAVSPSRVDRLRDKNRGQPLSFHKSLDDHIEHSRSDEIFEFCVLLEAVFRKYRLSPWDRLQTVLRFCQPPNIQYVHDDSDESVKDLEGTRAEEYCRYPLETLADRKGDCDCHSVLAACLFYTLGYHCCVFALKTKDRKSRHLAVGVRPPGSGVLLPGSHSLRIRDQEYYYCETTGNWQIGRIPEDMDPDTIEIWWPRRS